MEQVPPPAPPVTLEELVDKLQKDISTMDFYMAKLRQDRTRLNQMLRYYRDNIRYLRRHQGVIEMDHYRKLRENLKKCEIFLKNAENDLDKFEKNMKSAKGKLECSKLDLAAKQWQEENKVLQFRKKE